ncbi:MAG TPA: capreomycidine synthase [Blastocatellia bacterium]|nr:capreomycidine synthase [Blastocatellia bacterium]
MREYYFATEIDIGSSGVECFSFGELRHLIGLEQADLDEITLADSLTMGGLALRTAIAERWGSGDPNRVMATHGSSEAIYLVMNSLVRPGDEVVVVAPCYQQLYSIAESVGCTLRRWEIRFDRGFRLDMDEGKALIGPKTRLIVANFPHNPTGATLSRQDQTELIRLGREAGAYVLWDSAFADLTYGDPPLPDPASIYEKVISLGTLSKSFGLPGLRVGWCIAPPEVLEKCIEFRDYITLHLSPVVELIARKAIEHAGLILDIRSQQARRNLERLGEWVARHNEHVAWVKPGGGVCAFPKLLNIADSERFCRQFAREQNVLLVPGTCFGSPSHVRLGFGGSEQSFAEGLSRLSSQLLTAT